MTESLNEYEGYALPSRAGTNGNPWGSCVRVFPSIEVAARNRSWDTQGVNPVAVTLTLPDGAFFEVQGDTDMSEGRGALRPIGKFLDYWVAYAAARGQAAQGRFGYISVMVPYEQDVTVIGYDGKPVALSTSTAYRPGRLDDLIEEQ